MSPGFSLVGDEMVSGSHVRFRAWICFAIGLFGACGFPEQSSAENQCVSLEDAIPILGSLAGASSASATLSAPQMEDPWSLWLPAAEKWRARKWQDAAPVLQQIADAYPDTDWEANARGKLGLLLKLENDWDAALVEFDRALALNPPLRLKHDIKASRSCILLSRGNYDEAEAAYREMWNETPDWDQKKYAGAWLKEVDRLRGARQHARLGSCGAKSLAAVLQIKGRALDEDAVRRSLSPHEAEAQHTLAQMEQAAGALGFEAGTAKVTIPQLADIPLPALALLKPEHYVIVTRVDTHGIEILDTDRGQALYTRDALARLWTGYVLLFEKPEGTIALATADETRGLRGGGCPCCPPVGPGVPGGPPPPAGPPSDISSVPPDASCPGTPALSLNLVGLNILVSDIDLRYQPVKGPEMLFKRYFNNDSNIETSFGRGWTHNFNLTAKEYPGDVQVMRGDGRLDRFIPLGDGRYSPPVKIADQLTKSEAGLFALDALQEKVTYQFDADGRLDYLSDRNGNRVTLSYTENAVTSHGSGTHPAMGYFNNPRGLAVDGTGNIYVADSKNHRIQKYDAQWNPLLEWGTYGSGLGEFNTPIDVAVDPAAGYVYVTDEQNHRIQRFNLDGGNPFAWGSLGTAAGQFRSPRGIAVDQSGMVYVSENAGQRIQKFDMNGIFQATWGGEGNGPGQFMYPDGLEVAGGLVYVVEETTRRVQVFDTSGAWQFMFGSKGTAIGQFTNPNGIAVDPMGNIYVSDDHRLQKFSPDGGQVLASWGILGNGDGQFSDPRGIAALFSGGASEIVVADTNNHRIQRFDPSGGFLGSYGQGGIQASGLNGPSAIAIDQDTGTKYICDTNNHRIVIMDQAGTFTSFGSEGNGPGQFYQPRGLAYDRATRMLYVADQSRVQKLDMSRDGAWVAEWSILWPYGVALNAAGDLLYVVTEAWHQVYRIDLNTSTTTSWGEQGSAAGQFLAPRGIVVDAQGLVYVADFGNARIQKFDASGGFLRQWPYMQSTHLSFGVDGYLYAAQGGRVVRLDREGNQIYEWGVGGMALAAVVDGAGKLFVADAYNNGILEFSAGLPLGKSLAYIADAGGNIIYLDYDYGSCKVASLNLNQIPEQTVYFNYNLRKLVSSLDMAGVESTFSYNSTGYLETMAVLDRTYTIAYDGPRPVSITLPDPAPGTPPDPPQITITHVWHNVNSITDPNGRTTRFESNPYYSNNIIQDALGNQSTFTTYDSRGRQTSYCDDEWHMTSWVWDDRNRMTSFTDTAGRTTTYQYDDMNHTRTVIPPPPFSGQSEVSRYDANENLLGFRDASGHETTYTYYSDGRLATVTTPLQKTTTYFYDDQLHTTTIRDPLNRETVLTTDALGRLLARRDPLGRTTEYEYDALGRQRLERHPDGTQRQWEYDCCSLSAEIDELSRRVEYTHVDGKLDQVILRPDALEPSKDLLLADYDYDNARLLTGMRDTLDRRTDRTYDELGRLTSIAYPDQSAESYTYFKDDRLKTRTDRMGRTTTYGYDGAGRLATQIHADNSSTEYLHDEMGRRTSIVTKDTAGVVQTSNAYTYTPSGQVETETATLFGIAKTLRFGYRADGLRQWWRDESVTPNKTTTYAYYDDGRPWTITDPDGKVFTFEYNADGSLKKKSYANGMWAEYEYSNRGWLTVLRHRKTTQSNGIMAQFVFKDGQGNPWYDAVGNRTAADVTGNEHHTYDYDENRLDRLLSVNRPGANNDEAFTYDEMSNRLTSRQYSNWNYDPLNDELDSFDSESYTYDANGNRVTRVDGTGTTTYAYDYENRLIRVDRPGGNWTTYDYDAQGRRVRKIDNGTATLYWYESEDIVLETDAAGAEQARYTHGPGIDAPLKVKRGSNTYYYHEDPLGSIVLMTDATKNSSKTYKYDAFGNVLAQSGSVTNFYMYTGREYDSESALYYYRARTYDPKVGRFLQQDPLPPRPMEINAYVYVMNDPINLTDPRGLLPDHNFPFPTYDPGSSAGAPYWIATRSEWIGWVLFRTFWNWRTPPGTPYPPDYGDEGPGATDPMSGSCPRL